MKSILKIYWRYVQMACLLVGFVVFINLTVWIGFMFHYATVEKTGGGNFRMASYTAISEALVKKEHGYEMQQEGILKMEENQCAFALLLDGSGRVVWDWQKPAELPGQYSLGEVAAFSKWYLQDYPVGVWRYGEDGLLVFGYPKGSIVRQNFYMQRDRLDAVFAYVGVFFLFNGILVFALALLFGYRFYRSLKPVGEGIEALAEGQTVHLREKGMTQYLRERLNQTSDLLESQKARLARRDQARTEWIAGVSHDIRTPLSVIAGYAEGMETDSALPGDVRRRAGCIREQSFVVKKLIEDLNLTSKLTYQMQPLRREAYVPAAWLRETAAGMLNSGALPQDCRLELETEPELEKIRLWGDVQLLTRALQNLLGNCVRHNPGGCWIHLQAAKTEEGFCFCVEDDGSGVPKAVQQIVEENGSRNQPADQRPHVLGLLVVQKIAAAHGGRLWFDRQGRQVWVEIRTL